MSDQTRLLMDKMGIWVSGLCAIHCLALPLLLPIAPLIASSFVAEAWFERSILTLSLLVGFSALTIGYFRYHRKTYPVYALIAGGLIYWYKDMFGEQYEPFTIALGAGLIITAHVMNLKLCKAYKHRSSTCEETALPAGSKF